MATKKEKYAETDILTLEFEDGAQECGIIGTFEFDGGEYIALESLDEAADDIYLFVFKPVGEGFELLDIPDADYDKVSAEFDRLAAKLDS